jgi:exosome complex RNA-binding protein Csl4
VPWNGSAPNQQAGRTDGVRVGDDVYQQQAAAPVSVDATLFDVHDSDLKDIINACFKKDGGNTATADLPMGGFKFTNVAEAAARTQYARFSQLQDNKGQYVATVGGTADAITLTPSPAITAYVAGQRFTFIAGGTNTGAATVNVSGVGAVAIRRNDGSATALSPGDIVQSRIVDIEHNGTVFLLVQATGQGVSIPTRMPATCSSSLRRRISPPPASLIW